MNRKFIELPFLIFLTLVLAGCTEIRKQFVDMRGIGTVRFYFNLRTELRFGVLKV